MQGSTLTTQVQSLYASIMDRQRYAPLTLRSTLDSVIPSIPKASFSSAPNRYLQPSTSADRVPLRKQLKQEAKALRSHKKQRKETEEASRQEWELTVGVEIHAQLDTEAKLFSRQYAFTLGDYESSSHKLNRGTNFDK